MKIKVGIVGATGFTGEELIKTLQHHPGVELVFATSNSMAGRNLLSIFPAIKKWGDLTLMESVPEKLPDVDAVFLCLPPGESFNFVSYFIPKGTKIIDLGPDFRFSDKNNYWKWYSIEHPLPDLLREPVYGLPEFFRDRIKETQLVANPGCYSTSILLGILPLLKEEVIQSEYIISDSKSGITGAGKSPSQRTHFVNVNENIKLYSPGRSHRHVGEMEEQILSLTGRYTKVIFNPQIIPVNRGILSIIHCRLRRAVSVDSVYEIYEKYFIDEPFVKLIKNMPPDLHMVQYTNYCFIHVIQPEDTQMLTVTTAIDNLGKGASRQAIQNFNIMFGLEETICLL